MTVITKRIVVDAQADSHQPTAEDLAQAMPIVTLETILVCGGVTALLTVVLNIFGLAIGLVITVLVIRGNAQVRQMSIQNAVEDRLEREGHVAPGTYLYAVLNERNESEVE